MSKNKKLDPRVKRTRAALRDALVSLIEERGYEVLTVQEITERAGLNRATFYLHYQDKHDLLEQSSNEMIGDLRDGMQAANLNPVTLDPEQPNEALVALYEKIAEQERFYRVMMVHKGDFSFTQQMRQMIYSLMNERLTTLQPDVERYKVPRDVILNYGVSAYIGVIIWWLQNDMPYPPRRMVTYMGRLMKYGPFSAVGFPTPDAQ